MTLNFDLPLKLEKIHHSAGAALNGILFYYCTQHARWLLVYLYSNL